jgi:deazaflavin-dependent oxidoreductase (nitroreductase family)
VSKTYQVGFRVRLINRISKTLIRWGLAPKYTYLLTVPGRKTGRPYSTPVSLVELNGQRWLVAPYGEVSWVRNARVAGRVTLTRGQDVETVTIVPADPKESALVLKRYLTLEPITRAYFDAQPDSPLAAFEAEAERHPVFRIGISAGKFAT